MKISILLLCAALTIPLVNGSKSKEKLLLLIKTLQKFANGMEDGDPKEQQVVTSEETILTTIAPVTQRQLKTIKPGIAQMDPVFPLDRDPAKSYCNDLECVAPTCEVKDITFYGNLRKTLPKPEFFKLCGVRMYMSPLTRNGRESHKGCCMYNATLMSINSNKMWDCLNEMFTRNKKAAPVPAAGAKFWTSGAYSSSCGKHAWCPEKENIGADAKWRKGYPKDGAGDCIAVHLGSSNPENNGFMNIKCSENLQYICYAQE